MNNTNIKESDIFIRYLASETTEPESKSVESWIAESAENREYFEQVKTLWNNSADKTLLDKKYFTENALKNVLHDIQKKDKPAKPLVRVLLRVAAVASILIVLAGGGSYFIYKFNHAEKIVETTGNVTKISFPDNSVVWLNRNSKIIYSKNYRRNRHVKLSGEGYFEVQHDSIHPFVVETSNSLITVVGTKFNVCAWSRDTATVVVVTSGKVRVTGLNEPEAEHSILLLPGDKGVNERDSEKPKKELSDDPNYLSWKTHDFTFNNTNIKDIVRLVNEIYNTNIRIENESVDNCNLTGKYSCHSLDDMLDMLRIVLNITVERKGDEIIINTKGC